MQEAKTCIRQAIAHISPAKVQTFVPVLETNSMHTRQIHIVLPSKHFLVFLFSKKLLVSWTGKKGKKLPVNLNSTLCFQGFVVELHSITIFSPCIFHMFLTRLFMKDRKGSTISTRAWHFCYIFLHTGDVKTVS